MRLISLNLYNFRQHRDTRIEFMPGVTGIIGKNGAGKTTVLEAIAWALYGGMAVRGTNETIRSRASEGNAPVEVTLSFALGAHEYTVKRRLEASGRTSANLIVDGVPARTGFREVTESITKLLGMDYHAFFTSFFTAQKEINFMRGMDGRSRAAAVSRMLGYERLIKAREKANQDRLGLQREIEGLERGLGDPEEIKRRKAASKAAVKEAEKLFSDVTAKEESARKEVERLKPLRELAELKAKRALELKQRIELDKAEEKRAAGRIETLKAEVADLLAKQAELESLAPQLEENQRAAEEYRKLAELQKHETRRSQLQGKIDAVNYDLERLTRQHNELSGADDAVARLEKAFIDLGKQIEDTDSQIQKQRDGLLSARNKAEAELAQIKLHREEIAAKRKTIEDAGPDGVCPTCERPLAEELPKVLSGFSEQISALEKRAEELTNYLKTLAVEPEPLRNLVRLKESQAKERDDLCSKRAEAISRRTELTSCIDEIARKQQDLVNLEHQIKQLPSGFDQNKFNALRELGEKLKPVREKAIELKAALSRSEAVHADLKREEEALFKAKSSISIARKSLDELQFDEEENSALITAYDKALAEHNTLSIEVERVRGSLLAAQAALTAAENDEKTYKSKEAELKEKRRLRLHLQVLADAFDDLRNDLNSRTAPELGAIASEILAEMTDGRYTTLEVNEDYEATIRDDGEPKPIISGGEEDIVNLSLRLAVSRMIADRAGQDLSVLVLDEVFGSLDDIRRDNVIALLQALKSRFEQIILITHIESVHDAVDNCIWIDYDEGTKTSQVRTKTDLEDIPAIAI
ncbi:MAG TPA: AAA family ATPase [Armatimonadota bacterium]|nr:AAA family ATPase [Armatimonadota bacterium]